ncbi:hypothetical protein GCM10027290_58340 [Micromonospora sonneratiae]
MPGRGLMRDGRWLVRPLGRARYGQRTVPRRHDNGKRTYCLGFSQIKQMASREVANGGPANRWRHDE